MRKLICTLYRRISKSFNINFEDIADGIETHNNLQIVMNILEILLKVAIIVAFSVLIVYIALRLWGVFLIGAFLYWWLSSLAKNDEGTGGNDGGTRCEYDGDDEVEVELKRQKAIDIQEVVADLAFLSIQATSSVTALARPCDKYDILPTKPDGTYFYLYKGVIPIFQWEATLEGDIDKDQEDIIQRELQRNISKHSSRFPVLMSEEVRGRAAVEVLDVKNLGDHVLIEMVLVNSDTIPLVDASRRARVERKMKQERVRPYVDEDYGE